MSEVGFLVGRTVIGVEDGRIIFERGSRAEPELYADVGTCTYRDVTGGDWPLSTMIGTDVIAALTDDGALALSLSDGRELRCEPQPDIEAWQVVGGTPQYLVICCPGGELAVWDSSYVPSEDEAEQSVERLNQLMGWNVELRAITKDGGLIVGRSPDESTEDTER